LGQEPFIRTLPLPREVEEAPKVEKPKRRIERSKARGTNRKLAELFRRG